LGGRSRPRPRRLRHRRLRARTDCRLRARTEYSHGEEGGVMSPEATDFLYPFIEGDETDASSLLVDLARSAREKRGESTALRSATLDREHGQIEEVAGAMAQR